MPYRRVGKVVQKKKGQRWVREAVHKSVQEAKDHLTALRINVEAKEK